MLDQLKYCQKVSIDSLQIHLFRCLVLQYANIQTVIYKSHHLLCFPNKIKGVDLGNNNFSKFYISVFQRWGFFSILSLCQSSNTSCWFLEKQNGNTFGLQSMLKFSSFISKNISLLTGLKLE